MKTSVISILLGGIFVLPIATTVYGGTAQDHLPHNTHKTMTPEEQRLANERRIPFDTRIKRMKVLIERAQASQEINEQSRLLEQHLEEMQQGLAKIEQMRHVRTRSDIQRRIDMTKQLVEQVTEHQSEWKRMAKDSQHVEMQEIQQNMANIEDMRYVRTNAEINRKVDMMHALMEQMATHQRVQKRDRGDSVSTQSPYGAERVGVADSRNQ